MVIIIIIIVVIIVHSSSYCHSSSTVLGPVEAGSLSARNGFNEEVKVSAEIMSLIVVCARVCVLGVCWTVKRLHLFELFLPDGETLKC